MKTSAKYLFATAALLCSSGASFAQTLVSESFTYGAVTSSIASLNGGINWSSPWAVNGTANGQYQTTNLTISTAGYWNPPATYSGTNSGSLGLTAINNNGGFAGSNAVRQFTPGTDTTMWMSYLFNLGDYNANTQAYLLMNTNVGNSIRIAGTGSGSIRVSGFYNNSGTTAKDLTSSAGNTYLVLARFSLTNGNDSFQLWVNPSNLTGGEAGLGTADYTSGSTISLFGSGAQSMNWGFRSSTGADVFVDNWRISYGGSSAAGLAQVLTDPSTWATWSGGGSNANWDTAENWTGYVAPTNGSDVTFLSGNGSGSTILLNGSRTNGTVTFNNTDPTPAATTFNGGVSSVWTVNNGILMTNSSADFTVSDSNLSMQMDSDGMFLTNTTSQNLTVSAAIAGGASAVLTKGGSGTVTLSGANNYSGATVVTNGTLNLNRTGGESLSSTASVTVHTGATLLVSQSDQVNGTATVTLSGGTIQRASGVSEVFGDLTVDSDSTLDFGSGTAGNLTFGTYAPSSLLTVNNFFGGNTLVFGSNLTNSIPVGTYNTTSYSSLDGYFTINSISGGFTTSLNGSTFTITAIPEPSTVAAAIGLAGLMLWPARRRLVRDARCILGTSPRACNSARTRRQAP